MKLTKVGKIELIPPPEGSSRYNLSHLFFDAEKGHLVACDGFILAVLHVEPEEGDTTGYIPNEAMKYARELLKKHSRYTPDAVQVRANAHIVTVTDRIERTVREWPRPEGKQFPNYAAVMPKVKDRPPTICLNYVLLKKLAEGLGDVEGSGVPTSVALWITDGGTAVVVKTCKDGPLGIIMPVNLDKDGWKLSLDAVDEVVAEKKKARAPKAPKAEKKAAAAAANVVPISRADTKPENPQPDPPPENPEEKPVAA